MKESSHPSDKRFTTALVITSLGAFLSLSLCCGIKYMGVLKAVPVLLFLYFLMIHLVIDHIHWVRQSMIRRRLVQLLSAAATTLLLLVI